jgi:hypothetical protein
VSIANPFAPRRWLSPPRPVCLPSNNFGARAAAIEERPGHFTSPAELFSRIAEAGGGGAIIHGFVNAARTIVITNTLFKGDTGPDVTEARDLASQDLFDGTLPRIEEHDRLLAPVRPKAATILDIVGSELGVLPRPLKETIQVVLDFKGRTEITPPLTKRPRSYENP